MFYGISSIWIIYGGLLTAIFLFVYFVFIRYFLCVKGILPSNEHIKKLFCLKLKISAVSAVILAVTAVIHSVIWPLYRQYDNEHCRDFTDIGEFMAYMGEPIGDGFSSSPDTITENITDDYFYFYDTYPSYGIIEFNGKTYNFGINNFSVVEYEVIEKNGSDTIRTRTSADFKNMNATMSIFNGIFIALYIFEALGAVTVYFIKRNKIIMNK